MKHRLLLSAPRGAPGPTTALKNHKAILSKHYDVDLISLEDLVNPSWVRSTEQKRFVYRVSKRIRNVLSVDRIAQYGENVIFGTFHPVHEGIVKKLNRLDIRPSFMWCSTLGQMEFTPNEMALFVSLLEYLRKGRIRNLFLHRRLFDSMSMFVKEAKLLPHSIDLAPYSGVQKLEMFGVHIDLFCRARMGKNILNQIAAFRLAQLDGKLHINFDTMQFKGITDKIGCSIVQHKWIPVDEYLQLVAAMQLSLQVTIGESFNYAVCERMCLGVPVLTTGDIYLIAEDNFLARHLCVDAPDTPLAIARAIMHIVQEQQLRIEISERSKERIVEVAEQNNKIVLDQIQNHFPVK